VNKVTNIHKTALSVQVLFSMIVLETGEWAEGQNILQSSFIRYMR